MGIVIALNILENINLYMKYFSFIFDYVVTSWLKLRIRPRVLQLPITSRCNSCCTTCNIWKMLKKTDLNAEELASVLKNAFFQRIEVVGVNGGEPSLHQDIENVISALFVLKKLKRVHIISNGMNGRILLDKLARIKLLCNSHNVKLFLTISIDAIGSVHDATRGISGAFDKTVQTVKNILQDKSVYCDELDIGCTISNANIGFMPAVSVLCRHLGVDSYYHLAVPNERLHTFNVAPYSIMNNRRNILLAQEYFYGEFKYCYSLKQRMRSFISYDYLAHQGKRRLAPCQYLRRDVTIDEKMNFSLCACAGKTLWPLSDVVLPANAKKIIVQEEKRLSVLCDTCIHYIVYPSIKSLFLFVKERFSGLIWIWYRVHCRRIF